MRTILCPTDFSDAAHNGIAYAAKLAQMINAEITLFNVQSKFELFPRDLFTGGHERLELVAERLEEERREVARAFRVACTAEVTSTLLPLGNVISSKAEKFDLVVMGSNGPDDLFKLFAGSNTYNTLRHTSTPFMLVPKDYVFSYPGKVVYAFDYLKEGTLPLQPLISFLKSMKSDLTILQILEPAYSRYAEEDLAEVQQTIRRVYDGTLNLEFHEVHSDNIPNAINDYINEHPVDMLALCNVHRNLFQRLFHRSVTKDLAAVSRCPIFVFPE